MKTKYFLLDVTIHDGEHEHTTGCIVRAKDSAGAIRIYRMLGDEYFSYGDGLTIANLRGVTEITKSDVKTLQKLMLRYIIN